MEIWVCLVPFSDQSSKISEYHRWQKRKIMAVQNIKEREGLKEVLGEISREAEWLMETYRRGTREQGLKSPGTLSWLLFITVHLWKYFIGLFFRKKTVVSQLGFPGLGYNSNCCDGILVRKSSILLYIKLFSASHLLFLTYGLTFYPFWRQETFLTEHWPSI